ncbi:DUF4352 domain-containing protein [Mesobacillus subterraneus]|uniref:DUF4352 domain-containing protein n=1 Tax=Mesobacillus subterraneus TaxID=285983 RepID=UPI002041EAE3|nr:DUF4352 domain-containing protein [Mesobacillus subterraneus]MCM3663485.1 DUF4352 domain-containing protein [Mesobacillus subterraneus]MCM3683255.1 DUF4352 domain-containing protein [Mesobacillus subterraneus]
MKKKLLLGTAVISLSLFLGACGSEESASKVDEPKKEANSASEKDEGTGLEAFEGKDFEEITAEDWKKINLSKKQFKNWLAEMEKPDESGQIMINKAEITDDNTIEIKLNNSDGDTLENSMTAPILDALIREIYKHSAYYKKDEPKIIFTDLTGFKIAEITEPVDFGESGEAEGQDLGTFKVGDKVDIAGTVITITGASYTDERNEFEEKQPEKVLILDLAVQNATQEELFFDAYELEIYDSEGTKMESYPIDYLTETLQPGKNITGRGAYGVSGKGPYEVYYTDFATDTKAMWNIDVK